MNGLTSFSPRPSSATKYTRRSFGKRARRFSRLWSSLVHVGHHVAPKLRTTTLPVNSTELTERPARSGSVNDGAGVRSGRTNTPESCAAQRVTLRLRSPMRRPATRDTMRTLTCRDSAVGSCGCQSLVLEPHVLPGREGHHVNRVDRVLGDPRPDPHQSSQVHDRREHHPVDRQLLDPVQESFAL